MRRTPIASSTIAPLSGVVGEGADAGAGEQRVEDAEQALAVGFVEFGECGEAICEAVVGGVEGAAGDVVEDEVVEADVERLGDAGDRLKRRRDAAAGNACPRFTRHS